MARKGFVALEPSLDFSGPVGDLERMEHSLSGRGIDANLKEIWDEWEVAREIKRKMDDADRRRVDLAKKLKNMAVTPEAREQGRQFRAEHRSLSQQWWEMEETLIPRILRLPNYLHPETPFDKEIITYESSAEQKSDTKREKVSHLELGKISGVLQPAPNCYPGCYYLVGQAAMLEQAACRFFNKKTSEAGFSTMIGSDFVRSSVLEGCGFRWDGATDVFRVEQDQSEEPPSFLHLVGGASLPSLASLVVRTRLPALPSRFACTGRTYSKNYPSKTVKNYDDNVANNCCESPLPTGLPASPQRTSTHAIVLTRDAESESADILTRLTQWYGELGLRFRIVVVPAPQLHCWEMSRAEIQLEMCWDGSFCKVASVSLAGDFISKRLRIYGPSDTFPQLVSVQVGDIWCLLAALMEAGPKMAPNLDNTFKVPQVLQNLWPGLKA